MKDYLRELGYSVDDEVIYKPSDEDNFYKGIIDRNSYGRLFITDNDGLAFFPEKSDIIEPYEPDSERKL